MASSVASATPPPSGHAKQYVFVDEYNRHKRLKVMRACDGCRKRKIRCDGAPQNGPWPCGSCVRLKLKCVPPTLDQDEEPPTPDSLTSNHQFSFQNITFPVTSHAAAPKSQQSFHSDRPDLVQEWASGLPPPRSMNVVTGPTSNPLSPLDFDAAAFAPQAYSQQVAPHSAPVYSDEDFYGSPTGSSNLTQNRQMPAFLRADTEVSTSSAGDPQEIDAGVRELTGHMGEFRIDITSEAPYISYQKKALADAPAVEETDVELPVSVTNDATVRIPPEMMPSDERAMDYFGYYFEYVHPYIPVLDRAQFYDQWQNDRETISPLLLEGMFACVARFLEEPIVARRWLALASRHEESFKDVSRLSTLQATILLTKARESLSKRGYYWRSWMAVKYMYSLSVELGLEDHYDHHRNGNSCSLCRSDCLVHTRIWQTLFVLEMLVGAPMGRSDFAIDPHTVQLTLPIAMTGDDRFEFESSRRCTYLAQAVHQIKISNALFQTMKRLKKDWALDPEFVRHNADLPEWLKSLPIDMQIHYSDDGRAPWIGSDHFVAYLHAYFHLVIIMHHRPQLQAMLERRDPAWKVHLEICLNSAMLMCRIQEALHRDFGFHGLQFMQRGINFTIYCVLTCTMLHLAAITSPDPVFNSQARIYFARHMRVVEHCLPYSSPEMQAQINALREAFSADTSKAFELKATLGLRSPPPSESHPTPPSTHSGPTGLPMFATPVWSNGQDASIARTMTPTSEYGPSFDAVLSVHQSVTSQGHATYNLTNSDLPPRTTYPAAQGLSLATSFPAATRYHLDDVSSNDGASPVWDPSGIFDSWNTAFGGGAPAAQPPIPQVSDYHRHMTPTTPSVSGVPHSPTAIYSSQPPIPLDISNSSLSQQPSLPTTAAAAMMPAVTPVMWQDAFTSAFVSGHGQKRYREASVGDHSAAFMQQYNAASKRRA